MKWNCSYLPFLFWGKLWLSADHSVSLGTGHPLANYNPAIISVSPGTEKRNKSPLGRQKALIIPMCCACLTIKLILISEQPTNSQLRCSSELPELKRHKTKKYLVCYLEQTKISIWNWALKAIWTDIVRSNPWQISVAETL